MSSSANSYLLRMTPEHNFDIHVLRTFTHNLSGWIGRLQSPSPDAHQAINQVILALNQTFREVEHSYRDWRNERIQSVLQHGFHYGRARIQAALYRREQGRPAATFPAIYPSFQFSGGERQPRSLPLTQVDTSYYPASTYVAPGPSSPPYASPQPQATQLYPFTRRNESAAQSPQVSPVTAYSSGFGSEGIIGRLNDHSSPQPHVDYPPPPYPPAHWRPPDPVPGSPPVPPAAAASVEVAIRYLEAVNKAITICIDFDAM